MSRNIGGLRVLPGLVVEMINWGRNVDLTPLYLSILLRLNIELHKVTRNHKVTFCLTNSQLMPDQSSKIDIMCNRADVSLSLNHILMSILMTFLARQDLPISSLRLSVYYKSISRRYKR